MSEIDNIVFKITRRGYFGQKLAHQAEATMTKSISEKQEQMEIHRKESDCVTHGCCDDGKSDPCD